MHQSDWCIFFDFMTINKLIRFIENWAPPEIAWERDNVGLQIGSRDFTIRNVFLALDLTEDVVDKAIASECNVIFTHHPFLFTPLKKIDYSRNSKAALIKKIILNEITVFSAHTNLDYTKDGVSFQLAKKIGLENVKFLSPISDKQVKLVVFVPVEFKADVAEAIFSAGGGVIGEYEECGFSTTGKGTFKGSAASNPVIGEKEKFTEAEEARLEVIVDSWKLSGVISAMLKKHPYEEPAFDIYPLKNLSVNYGAGAIGELKKSLSKNEFLKLVSDKLKTTGLKYSVGKKKRIKKVAVCGGTCSDLLPKALKNNADAFITADIKYHTFQDAEGEILLVDAGHYETENVVLDEVKKRFDDFFAENHEQIKTLKYKGNTNPVKFFINK